MKPSIEASPASRCSAPPARPPTTYLGDCWLLAELGAVAQSSPLTVRATVVDFADSTFGVALGGNFYRVDADLPVFAGGTTPKFAGLGLGDGLWVAIVEKAFAIHRYANANGDTRGRYRDVEYGDSAEALRAMGATQIGFTYHAEGAGTAFTTELVAKWDARQAVVFSTGYWAPANLVACHTYTVTSITRDPAGKVTSLRLRNPWGTDCGNPFIDLTPAKLAGSEFWLGWGNVGLAA